MADNLPHLCRVLTIDDLPDDVLLEIFDFHVVKYQYLDFRLFDRYDTKTRIESWKSLVHVCRRWRGLVLESPRRLNLQLCCYGTGRSTRNSLDAWPTLPLAIQGRVTEDFVDHFIPGLEHRICQIRLLFGSPLSEKLWRAMEVPFPELIYLRLERGLSSAVSVIPDSFLGGSAPRLRHLYLGETPFPGLPKLLLSATHLVNLRLIKIPHSGYISPEAMATCFSVLTSLEYLQLEFQSPQSRPDSKTRRPFPLIRSLIPTLAIFMFKGAIGYLEEFVARIDAPQLCRLSTTFFNDIDIKASELNQFISRTPTLAAYDEAHLVFIGNRTQVRLHQCHPEPSDDRMVEVSILSDRQLSTLSQICTSSLRLLSTKENLYIYEDRQLFEYSYPRFFWEDSNIEKIEWLDLLLLFTGVKHLYLSKTISRHIALALQELTGRRTSEVLPALKNVLLEGFHSESVQEGFAQFISARQLVNNPVAISAWHRKSYEDYFGELQPRVVVAPLQLKPLPSLLPSR